jgi:hypothetical protein
MATDADLAAHAAFGLAGGGPTIRRTDPDMTRMLTAALDRAIADPAMRARLLARLGEEVAAVDPPPAARHCQDGADLARQSGDPSTEAYALQCQRFALLADEDPTAALAFDDRIVAYATASEAGT